MENTNRDYSKFAEMLKPLGFTQTKPGFFEHSILRREFDFTATSMEGIPVMLWSAGSAVGVECARQEIREAMGL